MREAIRRDPGLALLILALVLAAAIYAPTLGYGLTNYDDPWLVRDNYVVRDASWASVHTIFFDLDSARRFALAPEYLPIRDLSMMLDYAVWGDSYQGFHLTNLIVYLAAIALWFHALAALGVDRRIAGLALLLWAVHPSHAESVAWLTERKGLLGAMFAGAALLGYARFRGGRWGWLAVAAVCAACAVWSKAPAAFAVAAIAPLELVLPGPSRRRSLVGIAVIGVVALAAFAPVVMLATSSHVVGTAARSGSRLAMVLGVHGFYVELAAMAMPNAVSYAIASDGPSWHEIVLGAVGLVAAVVAIARGPAPLRAGAILWLLGWLPASHLVLPLQMVVVADRYLLLPSLGAMLAIAVGIVRVSRARARVALAGVLVLVASLRALDAGATWASDEALWARAVASDPGNGSAWSELADATADPDAAMAITDEGLAHVDAPRLWLRKGLLLVGRGEREAALPWFSRAAEAGDIKAMSNLALLLGSGPEGLDWARRAVAAEPTSAHAQRTLGKLALAANLPDEALAAFEHAYTYEPGNLTNRFNLALALIALHRDAEARPHLEACLDGPPDLAGRARALLGR